MGGTFGSIKQGPIQLMILSSVGLADSQTANADNQVLTLLRQFHGIVMQQRLIFMS